MSKKSIELECAILTGLIVRWGIEKVNGKDVVREAARLQAEMDAASRTYRKLAGEEKDKRVEEIANKHGFSYKV